MRDPHVDYLYYTLITDETVSYKDPAPINIKLVNFNIELKDNKLTCKIKKHYSSVETAKQEVEDYLKAWEILAELKLGNKEIKFKYENAKVIDRNPSKEPNVVIASTSMSGVSTLTVKAHVSRNNYPEPPKFFRFTPDVNTLWGRYNDYLIGKEKINAMAYFCLSLIESNSGSRRQASDKYKINKVVLDKLGELTSTKGDITKDARKVRNNRGPLTAKERKWIEETVKKIILRVGEYVDNSNLVPIEISDLPELE